MAPIRIVLSNAAAWLIRVSFCLACLIIVPNTQANEKNSNTIQIQAALGFTETFRVDRWTPVTITLTNHSSDLIGQLTVEVNNGDEFRGGIFTILHRRAIELPRDSRKRYRFNVFLDNPSRPVTIRVSVGGKNVAQHTINLRNRFSTANLVLVLSRDADLDYLNDGTGRQLRVLYPHPELLPDRWQGYDGIAAIIIHGISLESLTARQFEAIKQWLARGGVIAISGGPDYTLLHTPRLAELVPATPVGISEISANPNLPALFKGIPGSFTVHRLARQQGQIRYRTDDFPLLIEQPRGHGRVLYLTFDIARPPFKQWPGMESLWLQTLRLPSSQSLSLTANQETAENPIITLIKRESKRFPQPTTVFVFLALYLGVLASGYRLANSNDNSSNDNSRRLLFCLIGLVPGVFALAAYLLFGPLLFPKGDNAVMLTTIEPFPHSDYAHFQLDLGLYSMRRRESPTDPWLNFSYAGVEPVFRPQQRITPFVRNNQWIFQHGTPLSLHPSDDREYVLHLLQGEDIVVFDIDGKIVASEQGLQLYLRNDSGRVLQDSWLIFKNNAYAIGLIPEAAELERSFDNANDAQGLWDIASLTQQQSAVNSILKKTVEALRKQPQTASNRALLLGFSSSPLRVIDNAQTWQRLELTLVRLSLPVTTPSSTSEHADATAEHSR